jgi:hypothetical protein
MFTHARRFTGNFDTNAIRHRQFARRNNARPHLCAGINVTNVPPSEPAETKSPSALIDERISDLGDWRGDMLSKLRAIVLAAEPAIVEEWKWRGVPVWECEGMICTGETYKTVVKMTFAKGASLPDPSKLFNSSLEGNTRRAIDFTEGEKPNEPALGALVASAVALNKSKAKPKAKPKPAKPV